MKRKTANIDIRVEPEQVDKIDGWRALPARAAQHIMKSSPCF
jgi:hypothetical protein